MELPQPSARLSDVWLAKELLEHRGWTDKDLARLRRAGVIHRLRYGAYVDAATWETADDLARHQLLSRAVLKRAHPSSVLSHHSALAEWGVPLWGVPLDEVQVTRTDMVSRRREAGVRHHKGRLAPGEIVRAGDVPTVAPVRAAVELLCQESTEVAVVLLDGLLHAGLTTVDGISAAARATEHWPHRLNGHIVLGLLDARHESVAERRFSYLCWETRLPRPDPQVEVHGDGGTLLGVVDFLWREFGVFLEFDGRVKYERYRRPGETLEEYLMREKRREEAICLATGWVCIRIGWADLARPHATARRIRRLLESRSGLPRVV